MQRLAPFPLPDKPLDSSRDSVPAGSSAKPPSTLTATPPLTWRVHLSRERPSQLAGVAAAALTVFAGALALFHSLATGTVAAILILVSVAEYLLPLTYTLDDAGAKVSCGPVEWLGISWDTVRAAYPIPGGIKLSPFADPKAARLEACRGIRLRVPPDRMAEISAAIAALRGEAA